MLPTERRLKILKEIQIGGLVSADRLGELFNVSLETVRRDLRDLEREGLLQRVYGGAIGPEVRTTEVAFEQRRIEHRDRKRLIAETAVAMVKSGETIFIDAGSTCLEFARALPSDWSGRVLTDSLLVAIELTLRPNAEVILTGGQVRGGNLSCSGPYGLALHEEFYVAQAFVGAGGVHPDAGITDYHPGEGSLRRLWRNRSAAFYVLADSGKLGAIAPYWVAPIEAVTALVTDAEERREVLDHLQTGTTEVIVAKPGSTKSLGDSHRQRRNHVGAIPAIDS
jgi:DeoR/GlpR family transcriptional regulator of sugar metabolism